MSRGCAVRLAVVGFPAACPLLLLLQEGGETRVGETFKAQTKPQPPRCSAGDSPAVSGRWN